MPAIMLRPETVVAGCACLQVSLCQCHVMIMMMSSGAGGTSRPLLLYVHVGTGLSGSAVDVLEAVWIYVSAFWT